MQVTTENANGRRVVLTIPRNPPPTGNVVQRFHWTQRAELKKLWADEVSIAAMQAGRPKFKRAKVQLVLYYRQRRVRDSDNLMAGAGKLLLDGLRYANVIPDDDQTTIELPEPIVKIDKRNPRVEIELESVPVEKGGTT